MLPTMCKLETARRWETEQSHEDRKLLKNWGCTRVWSRSITFELSFFFWLPHGWGVALAKSLARLILAWGWPWLYWCWCRKERIKRIVSTTTLLCCIHHTRILMKFNSFFFFFFFFFFLFGFLIKIIQYWFWVISCLFTHLFH